MIINDNLMVVFNQATGNIAAHAAETNHADLHNQLRSRQCALDRGLELSEAGWQIAFDMHPQRAPATLQQHVEIATRLRRFDDTEVARCPGIGKSSASSAVICKNTPLSGPPL